MNVLVDSDILIEVCRGRDKDIVGRWLELSGSETAILYSPVTAAELCVGVLPGEHTLVSRLFQALLCAEIDSETGQQAGSFLRQYQKSHNVGLGDALIAATALQNQAALWTRDRKHYPMKQLSFF